MVSPGVVLAIVVVLIAAQIGYVVMPHRGAYRHRLILAVAGFLGAEVFAAVIHGGGPTLGVIHPVVDVVVMASLQAAAIFLVAPRERA